ncbi:MAG TPA: hypothetical protein VN944_00450 [Nitrospiria bacterium]|nr:hypothetical protein [Nitrospiria bacterium]
MKSRMNLIRWWMAGTLLAFSGMLSIGTSSLAGEPSIHYPVKRIVTGLVMSVTLPSEKGRDGEIMVGEKLYRLSSKTVMVDQNDHATDMKYFQEVAWVYMVVDLYKDHREVLFISPANPPVEHPAEMSEGEDGKSRGSY